MCISEETAFIMDQNVAAISEIFLTELLREENTAESAARLKKPIGPLSDIHNQENHRQEASLSLFG